MKKILLITSCFCSLMAAQAQSIDRQVVASGGRFAGTGAASISYTVGETAIQYLSASGASVSQGFQQSSSNSTGIKTIHPIDAAISTYPNPFVRFIDVKSDKTLSAAAFQLIDINGKTVPVTSTELQAGKYWRIQMGELSAGNYWLKITSGNSSSSFPLTHLEQ